ncbi:hypothetical protein TURU_165217 [Turdus rufiventris]|nr:hypothetical protein TURU_165217 [Turdus rufiventris]
MNGSVAGGGYAEEIISLTRRPSGLGFNIVGGTDQQYIANDNSIYVSWIKKDGAAYLDGRLQEGDKILAINGKDLKDLRHRDAVELFRNAGYHVSLKIQRRLQPQNGPVSHQAEGDSDAGARTYMLLFKVNSAVWRCGMVQKAQIMEDGLEREKRLDNPEDSTVPAKGQGTRDMINVEISKAMHFNIMENTDLYLIPFGILVTVANEAKLNSISIARFQEPLWGPRIQNTANIPALLA